MTGTKPVVDRDMRIVILNLKPWKGKVSQAKIPVYFYDGFDVIKDIERQIKGIKEKGLLKRRTILSIEIPYKVKL